MTNLKDALTLGTKTLESSSISARLDAEILLCKVMNINRTYLYTYPEKIISNIDFLTYKTLIKSRVNGEPIAYLTGEREFWSLPISVSKHTLIPRPETECLVEKTLEVITTDDARILDLGTGSGAIAIALAHTRPNWQIIACDKSEEALLIAKNNANKLGISNITFLHSDWFTNINTAPFHAIVSNPPYIRELDEHLNEGDVRFEPRSALVSGVDGLNSLRHIIQNGCKHLLQDGWLILEHGYNQKEEVKRILNSYGYHNIQCRQDNQGNDRVSSGQISLDLYCLLG